jgi:SAM-dependent methyltransferase
VPRLDLLEVVAGLYLSQVLLFLHRSGLLTAMRAPRTVAALCAQTGFDPTVLGALLEFVHLETAVLDRDPELGYSIRPEFAAWSRLPFQLEKFVGAYGPPLLALEHVVRDPAHGESLADQASLAAAYGGLASGRTLIGRLVSEWTESGLLDVGCGSGRLLAELAAANDAFRGWGLDSSQVMCELAQRRMVAAGAADRVGIQRCDAREIGSLEGSAWQHSVNAVHAGSVFNAMPSEMAATRLVSDIQRLFPGRLLFVSDYYGRLTKVQDLQGDNRLAILQDVAQVISGQTIPPADAEGWNLIYVAAGSSLIHVTEGDSGGLRWFFHVVQL